MPAVHTGVGTRRVAPQPSAVALTTAASSTIGRTLGWVSIGTGGALLLGGLIGGAMFQSTSGSYASAHCETALPNADCQSMYDRMGALNGLQWAGYIGGGVLAVGGLVLVLTAPRVAEQVRPTVALGPGPGLVGVSAFGRF